MPPRALPLLVVLSTLPPPARAAATTLASLEDEQLDLFDRVAPAVVVIRAGNDLATGFAVAPSLVLTAAHAITIAGAGGLDVTLADGRTVRGELAEVSRGGLDVALVRVPATPAAVLALAPEPAVRTGSFVAVVGHGDGSPWSFSTGLVSNAVPAGPDAAILALQLAVRPGASGGPVVDRAGRVVAILTHGAPGAVAFAVRSDAVLRSLEGLAELAAPPLAASSGAAEAAAGSASPAGDEPTLHAPQLLFAPADPRPASTASLARAPAPPPRPPRAKPRLEASARLLARAPEHPHRAAAPEPPPAAALLPPPARGLASELVPAALIAVAGCLLAAVVSVWVLAADATPRRPPRLRERRALRGFRPALERRRRASSSSAR